MSTPLITPSVPATVPLGLRAAARALDVALLVAIDGGLGMLIGFGFGWLALGAAIILGYFAGCDAAFGATAGKRALGLRVVGPDGGRPTPREALVREAFVVVGAIPFVGPILALAAWIGIAVTARRSPLGQGWHDALAGGTRVVAAGGRA